MSNDRKRVYDHNDEITGASAGDDPATEHQDTAKGSEERRNEVVSRDRAGGERQGSRPDDATRFTRSRGD